MDIKKTNKKKLSTLIKQQVPEFVLTDHPKFTEFLTSYFLFMESAELNLDHIHRYRSDTFRNSRCIRQFCITRSDK